jgi:hypothetical protein
LDNVPPNVKFELPEIDENFLKNGRQWLDIEDTVNSCNHRVILSLKKNCNQLRDEEKLKIAIMLLNCELEVEKRPTYACTPEMNLRQCTIGMNDENYKIYHAMVNRVMAICFVLKQQQFKAAVEMTINQLLDVSLNQVSVMHNSLNNQKKVNEMAIINIRQFETNNDQIKEKQTKNLEDLVRSSNLIEDISMSLQRENELLEKSERQLHEMEKIAYELALVLEKTTFQMQQHYNEALEFMTSFRSVMEIINKLIRSIQNTFDQMSSVMNEIGLETTAEFLIAFFINIIYIILVALSLNFQNAFKYVILGLFFFNLISLFCKHEIPIFGTNILSWILFATFNYIFKLKDFLLSKCLGFIEYFRFDTEHNSSDESDEDENFVERSRSLTPSVQKRETGGHKDTRDDDKEMTEIFENQPKMQEIMHKTAVADTNNPPLFRPTTPAILRVMNTESSGQRPNTPYQSGMLGRVQCQTLTQKGVQCRNASIPGYTKCRVHNY